MFLNHNHIAYKGYIYYLKRWKDGRKEQKEELIRMLTPDSMVGPRLYCADTKYSLAIEMLSPALT